MTAPLTPALALAYLGELSVDVRSAAVLDAAGEPLAGDAALAPRVRDLLTAGGAELAAGVRTVGGPDGALLAARTPDGGAIAVLAGSRALLSLLGHDLAIAAAALATTGSLERE